MAATRLAMLGLLVGCSSPSSVTADAPSADSSIDAVTSWPQTLDGSRNRLLQTYLAFLKQMPDMVMSNGLVGHDLNNVCELWTRLDPSTQATYLTVTHRLQGSVLRIDDSHMLDHVTKLYRVIGGMNADATNPGECGGGEYNRLIMSMDATLHDIQKVANTDRGALQTGGRYDIADANQTGFWRDSHDLGGPHAPFDLSDETYDGAPRGQTQYFADPSSTLANTALGRVDVMTLVDPFALEMDEDFDCVHNSNPLCTYIYYGPSCAQEPSSSGAAIYTMDYGDFVPAWKPAGC